MTIVDMDQHLYEPRDMWAQYCDPGDRDRAIRIVDDPLGYPMLSYQGSSPAGSYCWMAIPGDRTPDGRINTEPSIGRPHRRQAEGLPAEQRYDGLGPEYTSPSARVAKLDEWGVDECFVFPQWALEFEGIFFDDDLEGLRVNHGAWNRYAADVFVEGGGRLHPAAYVPLDGDQEWVIGQLEAAARAGLKLVAFTPGLINGRRPSDPVNEPIWRAFIENDLTVCMHIGVGVPRTIPRAWSDNDHATFAVMNMGYMDLPIQLLLADFALNGVFMRHPDLRVAVVEQRSSNWLPAALQRCDGVYLSQPALTGHHLLELQALPSEYIRTRCRFGLLPGEDAVGAIEAAGEIFGFGADYPHVEGVAHATVDFKAELPRPLDGAAEERFFGGNALWVLGR